MSAHPDLGPFLRGADLLFPDRHRLLSHVRICPECRAAIAERDPSRLFALLVAEPIPPGVLARVSSAATAARARGVRRAALRRTVVWGALAASLVAAGVLGAYLWREAAAPAPTRMAARPAPAADPSGGSGIPGGMIEVLESPGKADLVLIAVGDLEVAIIFDAAMGI